MPGTSALDDLLGVVSPTPMNDRPQAGTGETRSPLSQLLLNIEPLRAFAASIAVPAGLAIARQAWYVLRKFSASRANKDASLISAFVSLMPTNNGASATAALTGYATPLAFGDSAGMSAAIVVHPNLPFPEQVWSDGPAFLPGIDFGEAAPDAHTLLNGAQASPSAPYLVAQTFPPGSFRDATPNKRREVHPFGPGAFRFVQGNTLDVALVVARRHVNGLGAAGQFPCQIEVALQFSPVEQLIALGK